MDLVKLFGWVLMLVASCWVWYKVGYKKGLDRGRFEGEWRAIKLFKMHHDRTTDLVWLPKRPDGSKSGETE